MRENYKEEQMHFEKSVEFQNELTGAIQQARMRFICYPRTKEVLISRSFAQFNAVSQIIKSSHIFYMDHQKKMFISLGIFPFQNEIKIKYQCFSSPKIRFRYRKVGQDNPSPKNSSPIQENKHVKKAKQRTIAQALDSVRYWRQLYEQLDPKGKKVYTRESAAQVVGISKKTLDDYHYQIKIAQSFNFDFERFRYQKIGLMRSFNRQFLSVRSKINSQSSGNGSIQNKNSFIDTDLFWAEKQDKSS